MATVKGYSYAFGWNIYYQTLLGVCAKSNENAIAKQRAWAWAALMMCVDWMPRTYNFSYLWGDLNAVIDGLSVNFSIAMSIAKIITLQCQRRVIGSILDDIAEDWLKLRSKEEVLIMNETARTSRRISIMSVCLTNSTFVLYIIAMVSAPLLNDAPPDPRMESSCCLFDAYFPFDTKNPAVFASIWLGQCLSTLLSMASYSGPDCIVSMMVLHLCGQIRVIRHSLKNLVNEATAGEPKTYWKTLIPIVRRHEELNELSFVIKDTFSSILLVQMLICSMTFCFQGYVAFTTIIDRGDEPLPVHQMGFSLLYSCFTVTHLFVYCYVGDRLLAESTEISEDFYDTPWYNLAPEEAKAFLFVCQRSRIPLELSAGKFCTFDLQLFNAIMKTSMGYLSMLMAMKDRLVD